MADEHKPYVVQSQDLDLNELAEGLGAAGFVMVGAQSGRLTIAELLETIERHVAELESARWRIVPNTHTVCDNPDPFEGPGETYYDAYHREKVRADHLAERNTWLSSKMNELQDALVRVSKLHTALQELVDDLKERAVWDDDATAVVAAGHGAFARAVEALDGEKK